MRKHQGVAQRDRLRIRTVFLHGGGQKRMSGVAPLKCGDHPALQTGKAAGNEPLRAVGATDLTRHGYKGVAGAKKFVAVRSFRCQK